MKIGIVTFWFERGAAYVSRAYMEALSKEHEVFIYARGGEEYPKHDPRWNLKNVTWGKQPKSIEHDKYIYWSDFRKWIKKNKIDAIIFNEQKNWDIVLKLRRMKILLGSYIDYYTFETVPFFSLYDFLLIHTKRHFSVFKNHPQPLFVQWGTDTALCKPPGKGQKRDKEVVFFHSAGMGGVNLRKGTDLLVKAFGHVHGPAKLIIHSQVGLEKYSSVKELIENDSRIDFFVGSFPPPGLYGLGDVYVYPSRLEGIGLSVVEALASGLPVITTDAAPMNEFVEHGKNGYLVEVERMAIREDHYYWPESICSINALTDAMQFYVDNLGVVGLQALSARNTALENFNWGKNSIIFRRLINKAKSRAERQSADYKEIEKYEAEHNIFLINAKKLLINGEIRNGCRVLANMVYFHPGMVFKKVTWQTIRGLVERLWAKSIKRLMVNVEKRVVPGLPGKIRKSIEFYRVAKPIKNSGLFDSTWYLDTYPDVRTRRIDPLFHYIFFGGYEGRNPSLYFDSKEYLNRYKDVMVSGMNPLVHYIILGRAEKRRIYYASQYNISTMTGEKIYNREGEEKYQQKLYSKTPVDIIVYLTRPLTEDGDGLESILSTTKIKNKILIISDQHDDCTRKYLAYIEKIYPEIISKISSEEPLGLAKAYNLGLSRCKSEYVILMTSSVIVHGNWAEKLSNIASLNDAIGIVSPITSKVKVTGSRCLDIMNIYSEEYSISYNDLIDSINQKLELWAENRGYPVIPFADDHCVLIKQKVVEKIGLFDDINFSNGSEGVNVDFCQRAFDSGFESVLATNTFVRIVN